MPPHDGGGGGGGGGGDGDEAGDEASKRRRAPAKARWSNWSGNNLDPDSVTRHRNSLTRAGFRDNNHAKGGLF